MDGARASGKLGPVEDRQKEHKHFSSDTQEAVKNTEQEAPCSQRDMSVHLNLRLCIHLLHHSLIIAHPLCAGHCWEKQEGP